MDSAHWRKAVRLSGAGSRTPDQIVPPEPVGRKDGGQVLDRGERVRHLLGCGEVGQEHDFIVTTRK